MKVKASTLSKAREKVCGQVINVVSVLYLIGWGDDINFCFHWPFDKLPPSS